jgi:hypothetical protein
VHFGIAGEEVLGGLFGLVKTALVDQIDYDIRRLIQPIVIPGGDGQRGRLAFVRMGACHGGGLVTRQATALVFLPAPAGTRIIAPDLGHRALEAFLYTSLLTDATLFDAFLAIDQEMAATTQADGCQRCPGRLHHSDYPRKPRGGPATLPAAYDWRESFCCARCRKRVTPPSVRFLGRRVYLGVIVVLACVLRQGPTPTRVARLREVLGVSADTLARWHRWWRDAFVRTAFWKAARGRFARPIDDTDLPRDLLARFGGEPRSHVIALLRFLSPLTTTSAGTLGAARG